MEKEAKVLTRVHVTNHSRTVVCDIPSGKQNIEDAKKSGFVTLDLRKKEDLALCIAHGYEFDEPKAKKQESKKDKPADKLD